MNYLKTGLLAVALLSSVGTFSNTLDRIVAVANNDIITAQELNTRYQAVKKQYQSNPDVLPNETILTKQILDALILESLQMQLAERGNLVIPEQQIDQSLSRLAQNQNMSLSQFITALTNEGQDITQVRQQIRQELTINEIQRQMIARQIFITDAEVNRFLNSQTGQSLQETKYQLGYLRLSAEDQDKADELITKLNNGDSILDEAESRDLGERLLAEVPTIFRTLVPILNKGEAVQLARDDVIHIAQLLTKSELESVNVEEYRIRHILISPDELFDSNAAKTLLADLREKIIAGASMAEFADTYSQDTGSRGRGGDLDWNSLDVFVPEFSAAARALPKGELSEIIESQYGFHILRVEDIRSRDISVDAWKNQIKNSIFQSRYEESLQRWLVELRAESYVEIRL